ncbi:hypothetical protein EIQ27_08255 [Xanthomonas campestris pv. armoraciae]
MGRGRGALTARGTRREPVPGGSVAASMPPHGPASGEGTAPERLLVASLKAMHTDHGMPTEVQVKRVGSPDQTLSGSRARCPHRSRDTP